MFSRLQLATSDSLRQPLIMSSATITLCVCDLQPISHFLCYIFLQQHKKLCKDQKSRKFNRFLSMHTKREVNWMDAFRRLICCNIAIFSSDFLFYAKLLQSKWTFSSFAYQWALKIDNFTANCLLLNNKIDEKQKPVHKHTP